MFVTAMIIHPPAYPGFIPIQKHPETAVGLSKDGRRKFGELKPWFHVKIKLFLRILGLHGTTSEMK